MNKRWVSNTSPLILLNKIGYLPLLTELCAELIIPKGVIDELFFHKEEQSRWELLLSSKKVITLKAPLQIPPDVAGWDLGKGESEVITFAVTSASSEVDVSNPSGGGISLKSPEDDNDLKLGMSNYGVYIYAKTETNDPDTLNIEYPLRQKIGQAFVTFGAITKSAGTSGEAVEAVTIQKIEVGATKLASEISNVFGQNAILVGGPCANLAAATALGNPADCTAGFEAGKGIIQVVEKSGKVAMIVAGYSAKDTRTAASVVANYKDYAGELTGQKVEVTTATSSVREVEVTEAAMEEAAE